LFLHGGGHAHFGDCRSVKPDFRKYWSGPVPPARTLNLSDQAVSTTNAIITLTLRIN